MKEEWGVVEGFPDYLVSSTGRIRDWGTGQEVKQIQKTNGHVTAELFNGEKYVTKTVGRLVAEAFFAPSEMVVRHRDGDRTNNHIDNLQYCTKSEIQQLLTSTAEHKQMKRVRVVETGQVFASVTECAKAFGVTRSAISWVLLGKRRSAAGHRFEYADKD